MSFTDQRNIFTKQINPIFQINRLLILSSILELLTDLQIRPCLFQMYFLSYIQVSSLFESYVEDE